MGRISSDVDIIMTIHIEHGAIQVAQLQNEKDIIFYNPASSSIITR